jgi:outer membrane protein assembly factor BamA
VANDVQASDDVENIERVCQGAGYMEAQARLERDIDDTSHMVSYHYFVKEGEQYHMGKLAIEGVDAQGTQTLASRWKIKEGEPYSGDYVRDYLREVTRLLPRGATVTIKPQPDRRTKAVNVTLNFAPR